MTDLRKALIAARSHCVTLSRGHQDDVHLAVLAVIDDALAPSRPVTAGARHAFDVHAYSDPADIDNHPLRHDPTRDLIESILFKRSLNKQLEGYALRTSLEIAIALAALSPQDCRADVIHECIDIVRKYDDTGASFIIEKLQALALAPKGAA